MRHRFVPRALFLLLLAPCTVEGSPDFRCSNPDPKGDARVSATEGFTGAPCQDVLRSGIARSGSTVTFSMDVAAPIELATKQKRIDGRLLWMWGISTDAGSPKGYPLGPTEEGQLEYWVDVYWDGKRFASEFVDRRRNITRDVPFRIRGRNVSVTVDSKMLGDPASFHWGSSTWYWQVSRGSDGLHKLDAAPVGGLACP